MCLLNDGVAWCGCECGAGGGGDERKSSCGCDGEEGYGERD